MTLLAIETSCDETSAAVIREGRILSNVVSSQTKIHAEYGGVVPELATREHVRNFLPVARLALAEANIASEQIDAVAATQGPGLPNALFIGLKAAQAFAYSLRKPFLGIHHHEAHLYSPWIVADASGQRADFENFQPSVSLIVSGGHTILVHVKSELEHRVLGSTLDDAAGECFDKVGKLIGLPYPAGPEIDRLAEQGNAKAFDFPRPMINDANDDFSFAGLKTSVRYFLQKNPAILDAVGVQASACCENNNLKVELQQNLRDLCASVQCAIVEVLVKKTIRAAKRVGVKCVTASGGVVCNRELRKQLTAACARENFVVRLAEKKFSTDNAAMIGILAERKFLRGITPTTLDAEIEPGWAL